MVSDDDILALYGTRPPRRRKPRGVVEAIATADADSMYGAAAAAASAAADLAAVEAEAGAGAGAAPSRSFKPARDAERPRRGPVQLEEEVAGDAGECLSAWWLRGIGRKCAPGKHFEAPPRHGNPSSCRHGPIPVCVLFLSLTATPADAADAPRAVRRGAQKPWERRQQEGEGDRPLRPQGRPGLRWRADAEEESDGGGEAEGRRGRSRRPQVGMEEEADGDEAGPATTDVRHGGVFTFRWYPVVPCLLVLVPWHCTRAPVCLSQRHLDLP